MVLLKKIWLFSNWNGAEIRHLLYPYKGRKSPVNKTTIPYYFLRKCTHMLVLGSKAIYLGQDNEKSFQKAHLKSKNILSTYHYHSSCEMFTERSSIWVIFHSYSLAGYLHLVA